MFEIDNLCDYRHTHLPFACIEAGLDLFAMVLNRSKVMQEQFCTLDKHGSSGSCWNCVGATKMDALDFGEDLTRCFRFGNNGAKPLEGVTFE